MTNDWEKIGPIVEPFKTTIPWIGSHAGSAFAMPTNHVDIFDLYVTGRDSQNRSQIGKLKIQFKNYKQIEIVDFQDSPILVHGVKGQFDADGVAYPWIVTMPDQELYLYYVGWQIDSIYGFKNTIGLAKKPRNSNIFLKNSHNPILPISSQTPMGTGSCSVYFEQGCWEMYYTHFREWDQSNKIAVPNYTIGYAQSTNGLDWIVKKDNLIRNFQLPRSCRPNLIKTKQEANMWFCARQDQYMIYQSKYDANKMELSTPTLDLEPSKNSTWDSESVAYPHIFNHKNKRYMIYCGNEYGKGGLGIAIQK